MEQLQMRNAHYGGKQLKPVNDVTYYGGKNVKVFTDASHYGGKY